MSRSLLLAIALLAACKSKGKDAPAPTTADNAAPAKPDPSEMPTPTEQEAPPVVPAPADPAVGSNCAELVTPEEIQIHCGAKGTFEKTDREGSTEPAGNATLHHVCARDIVLGAEARVSVVVSHVTGGQSAEEIVRTAMDAALAKGWAVPTPSMTGFVGTPPAAKDEPENLQLHAVTRGNMIALSTSRKSGAPWACTDEGLVELGHLIADRLPPAPRTQ